MADDTTAASPLVPAGSAPGGRREPANSVADSFRELQRTVRRSKARLLAAAGDDVESATHVLLHAVAAEGPMRASALAASVQADLSTVSRQVAALIGRGLLERQADQHDGRASLLAVTGAGQAAIAEHEQGPGVARFVPQHLGRGQCRVGVLLGLGRRPRVGAGASPAQQ